MGTFAETLRVLLQESQLSQAALARRLGLSSQAVSAWMSGGVVPTWENVVRIEDELAIEPRGSLLTAAGYSAGPGAEQPTVESLIRADPGLHPEDKRVFLRLIRMARERFAAESE